MAASNDLFFDNDTILKIQINDMTVRTNNTLTMLKFAEQFTVDL